MQDLNVPKRQITDADRVIGIDEYQRTVGQERELDELLAVVFSDAAGQKALDYLKAITINNVLNPGCNPNDLLFREGGRWLVGVIDTRVRRGRAYRAPTQKEAS